MGRRSVGDLGAASARPPNTANDRAERHAGAPARVALGSICAQRDAAGEQQRCRPGWRCTREWIFARPLTPFADLAGDDRARLIVAHVPLLEYRGMHANRSTSLTMGIRPMVRTVRLATTRYLLASASPARRPIPQRAHPLTAHEALSDGRHRWLPSRPSNSRGGLLGARPDSPQLAGQRAGFGLHCRPKADGYRGIHVVHRRAGRLVEVQLRTEGQHEWAEAIEFSSPRVRHNLKDGDGPADLREYFRRASDRIATLEAGDDLDEVSEEEFAATLREQVRHYFS